MKTKALKIILTILLVALLTTILTGCPPRIDDERHAERDSALATLTEEIIASSNELWMAEMPEESIEGLSNAGDYFRVESWARFATKVVDVSHFQTEKINSLIDFVKSDKGVKLLQGEEVQIFELIKSAGLTSQDAEVLIYDALEMYLKEGDLIYRDAIHEINKLSERANLTSATRKNLQENLVKLNIDLKSFENTAESRKRAEKALQDANDGIKTLISFAYNNSTYFKNNASESFFDSLSKGTLDGATSGEIATYLGAMFDSVKDMTRDLQKQADKVGLALELLSDAYDGMVVSNKLVDDIFNTVESGRTLLSLLPVLSDMVYYGKSIALKTSGANYAFVDGIKTALGDGYAYAGGDVSANEKIGYIRMGLAFAGIDYTATGDTLKDQKARSKVLVQYAIDEVFNMNSIAGMSNAMLVSANLYLDSPSDTMVGDIPALRICKYWVADFYLNNFKKLFAKHYAGVEIDLVALRTTAEVLMRYVTGEDVVNVGDSYTQEWFAEISELAESKMKMEAMACYSDVRADLDSKIDKFFNEGIDKLIELALKEPVRVDDENYLAFADEVNNIYESALLLVFPEEAEQ